MRERNALMALQSVMSCVLGVSPETYFLKGSYSVAVSTQDFES